MTGDKPIELLTKTTYVDPSQRVALTQVKYRNPAANKETSI